MPRTILLIDGDQYLYRSCAAVERDTKWDDENHVLVSNEAEAWEVVSGSINKILKHFGTTDYVLCFGEGEVFRLKIDETYKGNRKATRRPLCFYDIKKRMLEEFKSLSFNGLEADDVMGILATKPGPHDKIIVARDKDMKTIPGKLWDGNKFVQITEAEADYYHLYQTLVGDTADGYKGCPTVGPKKAAALLDATDWTSECGLTWPQAMWVKVVEAFVKAKLTEDDALRQARLARILRWSDWDSEKKEPILWTPAAKST